MKSSASDRRLSKLYKNERLRNMAKVRELGKCRHRIKYRHRCRRFADIDNTCFFPKQMKTSWTALVEWVCHPVVVETLGHSTADQHVRSWSKDLREAAQDKVLQDVFSKLFEMDFLWVTTSGAGAVPTHVSMVWSIYPVAHMLIKINNNKLFKSCKHRHRFLGAYLPCNHRSTYVDKSGLHLSTNHVDICRHMSTYCHIAMPFIQVVADLVKSERKVVHSVEELSLLSFEFEVARDYAQRRSDAVLGHIEILQNQPVGTSLTFVSTAAADFYFLKGNGGGRPGVLGRWNALLSDLDELATGTFVPHGRMYYAVNGEDSVSINSAILSVVVSR